MIGSLGTYCVISSSFWPMLIWHMRLGLSLGASKGLQIKFGFLTRIPKHIKLRNDLVMQIIKHICICLLKPITEIKLLNRERKSVGERERSQVRIRQIRKRNVFVFSTFLFVLMKTTSLYHCTHSVMHKLRQEFIFKTFTGSTFCYFTDLELIIRGETATLCLSSDLATLLINIKILFQNLVRCLMSTPYKGNCLLRQHVYMQHVNWNGTAQGSNLASTFMHTNRPLHSLFQQSLVITC